MVKDGGILTSVATEDGKLIKQARLPGGGNYYASLILSTMNRGMIRVCLTAGILRTNAPSLLLRR